MIRLYFFLVILILGIYFTWKYFYSNLQSSQRRKEIQNLSEISEELESVKLVTLKLIDLENYFKKTIFFSSLREVIDIQLEILKLYNSQPKTFSEYAKISVVNYTNSLVNILEKWIELEKKSSNTEELQQSSKKILDLLEKWKVILLKIKKRALDKEFLELDAEIQSMQSGLNLDQQ
jgi:5-bromo-4-chloroindolyl phosphate hydrolysis protein